MPLTVTFFRFFSSSFNESNTIFEDFIFFMQIMKQPTSKKYLFCGFHRIVQKMLYFSYKFFKDKRNALKDSSKPSFSEILDSFKYLTSFQYVLFFWGHQTFILKNISSFFKVLVCSVIMLNSILMLLYFYLVIQLLQICYDKVNFYWVCQTWRNSLCMEVCTKIDVQLKKFLWIVIF